MMSKVFFDIIIGSDIVGCIVMELFDEVIFKIVENFWVFCIGEKGVGKVGKFLYFKGFYFY